MRTKIFEYKGVLGAKTDLDNGKFINDPKGERQLGCVIDTCEIDITVGARQLLLNALKEDGSFAPITLIRHEDGSGSSIGLLGFWKHLFNGEDICIGRDCDKSILYDCNEVSEMEIPEKFKEAVDSF